MTVLTVVVAKRTANGNDLAGVSAAAGGDSFVNTGKEFVVIKNGDSSPMTLTIVTPATIDGDLAIADRTATIGIGETRMIGPFQPGLYNDTLVAGGKVSLTYSSVTSLKVNAVQINPNT